MTRPWYDPFAYERIPSQHPLPFKIGDRVKATRDACFSWNEDVQKGEEFTIHFDKDLSALHLVPGYYHFATCECEVCS